MPGLAVSFRPTLALPVTVGSFFNAEPRTLMTTPGIKETAAAALRIAGVSARRLARQTVRDKPVLASWQALLDYLDGGTW